MANKPKVLFLCTGNSCRSQMAEGLCRSLLGEQFEAYSAGIKKHGLNPFAIKVMAEIGIDITTHTSKTVDDLEDREMDYVLTVCGHADETCPFFAAKTKVVHYGFDDPPKLAEHCETEAEALVHYRRVRDEIKAFMEGLPQFLGV